MTRESPLPPWMASEEAKKKSEAQRNREGRGEGPEGGGVENEPGLEGVKLRGHL